MFMYFSTELKHIRKTHEIRTYKKMQPWVYRKFTSLYAD